MERDWFIFYRSFSESAKFLPDKDRLEFYDSIIEYAINWNVPGVWWISYAMFMMAKPQIDANNRRFEVWSKQWEHWIKGAEYWKLGWRPRKNPPKTPQKPPTVPPKNPPKEKEKEKEKEKVKDKDIFSEPKGSSNTAIAEVSDREYGNPEINKMVAFLRQAVWVSEFKESSKMERQYAKHFLNLGKKLWTEEFKSRLESILSDSFKAKNSNKLAYLYGEMKAFVHSPILEDSIKSF